VKNETGGVKNETGGAKKLPWEKKRKGGRKRKPAFFWALF
jgi:hypothetical protein